MNRLINHISRMFKPKKMPIGTLSFKNSGVKSKYETDGFVTIKLLELDTIKDLQEIFSKHVNKKSVDVIYDTMAHESVPLINKINEEVNALCQDKLREHLQGFKIVCSVYFSKKSDESSEISMHVDPSMTLAGFSTIGIWIPLVAINEETGKFHLLPRGQKLMPPYYHPSMPAPFLDISKEIKPLMTGVSLSLGEALFFNNNIVHYTGKNTSGKDRLAVIIKVIDKNAPIATAYYNPDNKPDVQVYEHEENIFLTENLKKNTPPINSKFLSNIKVKTKVFQKSDLPFIKTKIK